MKTLEQYLTRTTKKGGCSEWQGALNSDGYPRAGTKENSNLKVHREVFFLSHGYYPEVVRHSCDNPICIEPEHLIDGTNLDNVKDRVDRGRSHNHVPQSVWNQIISLRASGMKLKEIARTVGRSYKSIDYVLHQGRKES